MPRDHRRQEITRRQVTIRNPGKLFGFIPLSPQYEVMSCDAATPADPCCWARILSVWEHFEVDLNDIIRS